MPSYVIVNYSSTDIFGFTHVCHKIRKLFVPTVLSQNDTFSFSFLWFFFQVACRIKFWTYSWLRISVLSKNLVLHRRLCIKSFWKLDIRNFNSYRLVWCRIPLSRRYFRRTRSASIFKYTSRQDYYCFNLLTLIVFVFEHPNLFIHSCLHSKNMFNKLSISDKFGSSLWDYL